MEQIDDVLIKEVERRKTPSVQYVFFNNDRIIHRFQFGYADIESRKNATALTTYNAFSVTKTFTALAILQLAEQKMLDIERPVKDYLPDFQYSPDITIKQLLSHSAGIPGPIPLSWIHLATEHENFNRDKFFATIFRRNKKVRYNPNQKFSYSNLGYVLLGQLIEKVADTRYEDYIEDNILKRLSLEANDIGFVIPDPSQHATGYQRQFTFLNLLLGFFIDKSRYMDRAKKRWKPFKNIYVNGAPYGGLIGRPRAFVTYIQELLKPDCCLLKDDYKKMLFTENYTNSGKATGMCLSWFKGELSGRPYFAHAGGGGGYYCEIRIYPEGFGSVVMFNRTGITDERFLDKVDRYFF